MTKPIQRPGEAGADPDDAHRADSVEAAGGEAACWAHLVCPECGAITAEGHQKGCPLAAQSQGTPG